LLSLDKKSSNKESQLNLHSFPKYTQLINLSEQLPISGFRFAVFNVCSQGSHVATDLNIGQSNNKGKSWQTRLYYCSHQGA
jgi:hypothetical protein